MVEMERSKVSGKWKGLKGMGNVKDINEGKTERSRNKERIEVNGKWKD